jgi:hypothetical protein
LGVELEISKLELLVRCDDVCVPQPHFVEVCKHRNAEKLHPYLEKKERSDINSPPLSLRKILIGDSNCVRT